MRKAFIWFVLLSKRLYKKITFLSVLLLIPIVVVAFDSAAQSDSGIVTVLLTCEEPQDALAQEIIQELMDEPGLILFRQCEAAEARDLVSRGEADTAWVFPTALEEKLIAFSEKGGNGGGLIQIWERESNVPVRLAREKLSTALYVHCSRFLYLRYVRDNAPQSSEVSDETLLAYLDRTDIQGELFAFYDLAGNVRSTDANYLTAPVRGILAVLVAIAAMITAMFYQKDLDRGMFALHSSRGRILNEFLYQLVSSLNLMAAVFVALVLSGQAANIGIELVWLLLYSACCAVFGVTLRWLFGGKLWMAAMLPASVLLMLVVCPVFFDIPKLRSLQLLLPPTYLIQGVFDLTMIVRCIIFMACMVVVCALRMCVHSLLCWKTKGCKQ